MCAGLDTRIDSYAIDTFAVSKGEITPENIINKSSNVIIFRKKYFEKKVLEHISRFSRLNVEWG